MTPQRPAFRSDRKYLSSLYSPYSKSGLSSTDSGDPAQYYSPYLSEGRWKGARLRYGLGSILIAILIMIGYPQQNISLLLQNQCKATHGFSTQVGNTWDTRSGPSSNLSAHSYSLCIQQATEKQRRSWLILFVSLSAMVASYPNNCRIAATPILARQRRGRIRQIQSCSRNTTTIQRTPG